jgi:hydrogenase maturation protease
MRRSLVVGLGSHHGDDQVGWRVAERLAERVDADYHVKVARTPSALLAWLHEGVCERLVLCDACNGAGTPGSVHRWRWPSDVLALETCRSSHDLSLVEVLALAARLNRLPKHVWIWGVELAAAVPACDSLSPAVAVAVSHAAERIHAQLTEAPTDA